MEEREVVFCDKKCSLNQIPKKGIEYSWLNKDYHQLHQPVYCKDYLHDVVWANVHKTKIDIYGLVYNANDKPIDLDLTRILVSNSEDFCMAEMVCTRIIPLLHKVESVLGLKKSVPYYVLNAPSKYEESGMFIVESSKLWMHAPPMISMFGLLLRLGPQFEDPDWELDYFFKQVADGKIKSYFSSDRDNQIIKSSLKGINHILASKVTKIFGKNMEENYPNKDMTTFHNNYGIQGFSSGSYGAGHWIKPK